MAVGSHASLTIQSIVDEERSNFQLPSYQIDAANLATWLTGWGSFKSATAAICAGVIRDETVVIYDTFLDGSAPASNFARRELKALINFQGDTSGKLFQRELPCPDLDALTLETGDANYINLADAGVMAAWVTAFEALARSPEDDAETVTVISARVVGRNI